MKKETKIMIGIVIALIFIGSLSYLITLLETKVFYCLSYLITLLETKVFYCYISNSSLEGTVCKFR